MLENVRNVSEWEASWKPSSGLDVSSAAPIGPDFCVCSSSSSPRFFHSVVMRAAGEGQRSTAQGFGMKVVINGCAVTGCDKDECAAPESCFSSLTTAAGSALAGLIDP